jgi:hypothetical protein
MTVKHLSGGTSMSNYPYSSPPLVPEHTNVYFTLKGNLVQTSICGPPSNLL